MDWFWQGLLTNWLVAYIFPLVVGVVIGYFKNKGAKWASPIVYGLLAWALTSLAIYATSVNHKFITEQKLITTADNVQGKIRNWVDNFRLKTQRNEDGNTFFGYTVTMENGNPILVFRAKEQQSYITIQGTLIPNSAEQTILSKLTQSQRSELFMTLRQEAARQGVSYLNINQSTGTTFIQKRIPITAGLTEDIFMGAINYMDSTIVILKTSATNTLKMYKFLK